ncbi:MAG TPA: ATP synthase F1 subunit gamma [Candidatus Omnitrophica bacterium]|nr:ATP synthase F1 subunit gamma [Candidatus Omnitrophota bacterium]
MSGQLRTLKNRIRSISNTKKITRAMEMVSAAKLKRYQKMVLEGAPYADGLLQLLKRVSASGVAADHPLLGGNSSKRGEKKKALFVFTSDTGLCGSLNLDLINSAQTFLKNEKEPAVIIGVGKMGVLALKKSGRTIEKTFIEIKSAEIENTIVEIKNLAAELYLSGRVDSVYATYSRFISATRFKPVTEKLLPFSIDSASEPAAQQASNDAYIMEPSPETLFDRLVPAVFSMRVRQIFLESFVSEQMARMNAMHQATENASELIDELVLARNKARQAAITKELIEIISGSQALKA